MFDDLQPGARVRGLVPNGVAEIVQVSRFGADALNLVFRADDKVGERLLYRGEESAFEFVEGGRAYAFDADGPCCGWRPKRAASGWRICLIHTSRSARRRSRRSLTRLRRSMPTCCRANRYAFCWPTIRARAKRSWLVCS